MQQQHNAPLKWFLGLTLLCGLLLMQGSVLVIAQDNGIAGEEAAVGLGFTYRGELNQAGSPVNDTCDFEFTLWDDVSTGTQTGGVSTVGPVSVDNGRLTALVNAGGEFGADAFNGQARWLEVAVRCPAGAGEFTALSPRQALSPVPYALYGGNNHDHMGQTWGSDSDETLTIQVDQNSVALSVSNDAVYAQSAIQASAWWAAAVDASSQMGTAVNATSEEGEAISAYASGSGRAIIAGSAQGTAIEAISGSTFPVAPPSTPGPAIIAISDYVGMAVDASDNGIEITASATGVTIDADNNGVEIQSGGDGVNITNAGDHGIAINTTDQSGLFVNAPGTHGVNINKAGIHGLSVHQAGEEGLHIGQSGKDGIYIANAGLHGIAINNAVQHGLHIENSGWTGVSIEHADGAGVAVWSADGLAGYFNGDVEVTGSLSKGSGSFKIDHPLDPEGQFLSHSFVESPDMMNIYNGNALLDEDGMVWVQLSSWFEALNRDFRYQLTAVDAPGPNLYIAKKIANNRFQIAGGEPGMEVSWQVTGIRHDPYAEAHPIIVEEEKAPAEQGRYLHPAEWGQPLSMGIVDAHEQREGIQK